MLFTTEPDCCNRYRRYLHFICLLSALCEEVKLRTQWNTKAEDINHRYAAAEWINGKHWLVQPNLNMQLFIKFEGKMIHPYNLNPNVRKDLEASFPHSGLSSYLVLLLRCVSSSFIWFPPGLCYSRRSLIYCREIHNAGTRNQPQPVTKQQNKWNNLNIVFNFCI